MAFATGDVDALECVLRKIGIDDSEFTEPTGTGRVHIYTGNGSQFGNKTLVDQADGLLADGAGTGGDGPDAGQLRSVVAAVLGCGAEPDHPGQQRQ